MAKKNTTTPRGRAKKAAHLTMWDGLKYFDAEFTSEERSQLRKQLMDACGYGVGRDGYRNYLGFGHDIEDPAQDEIWPAFRSFGFTYENHHDKLCDYALIHVCRQLEIDYKQFAKNEPKLPIDGFVASAKRAFPEFKRPRNKVERKIQEHKLHQLWCDWHEEECARTKCGKEGHWLCSDRFAERDYSAILEAIAKHNESRPRLTTVQAPKSKAPQIDRVSRAINECVDELTRREMRVHEQLPGEESMREFTVRKLREAKERPVLSLVVDNKNTSYPLEHPHIDMPA